MAWHPLGWTPFGFSEIETFPASVLAHHYGSNMPDGLWKPSNGVPNFGDMTRFKEWPDAAIDLLVGGTPCQSFSVAGLRKGLADPRGNLALVYLAIADRYRPEWLVWENVPGVLSSNEGRDFGSFIGGLEQLGYHASWRVLDAQYVRVDGFGRAVPQRRRRVFVVGHLGDWRRAAAVLFERESLSWDIAPSRQSGKGTAPTLAARTRGGGGHGTDFDLDGGLIPSTGDVSHCLNAGGMGRQDYETETVIAHALRADGFDASEDGTGRGTPLVPCFGLSTQQEPKYGIDVSPTLALPSKSGGGQVTAVAFDMRGRDGGSQFEGPHYTANIRAASGGSSKSYVAESWAVRRLMPIECERLQGFPDGYTDIPYRGKAAADGPRYKALGNSMAVNVMRWIGRRIELVAGNH